MSGRHTVLGLAHPRSGWPAELSRWATSGAAPIEFLTCLTADEVLSLLGSGRAVSAVLLDGASVQVDRDLVAAIADAAATPIGVETPEVGTDWVGLGCATALPSSFGVERLCEVLERHCLAPGNRERSRRVELSPATEGTGRVIAVTGTGGTGASCVAMAVAQHLGAGVGQRVLLLDGCRRADQAMYHDTADVLPGLPELVEGVRAATVDPCETEDLVFASSRGYDVMLGQRRPADWATMRVTSIDEAVGVCSRAWDTVVVDHDGDLETRAVTGAEAIEDRNAVSLALVRRADLWLIVSGDGCKGLHAATRAVREAVAAGVAPERVQVVFNRVSRSPLNRTASAATLAKLTEGTGAPRAPLFVAECRGLEAAHRDGSAIPARMIDALSATGSLAAPP